VRLEGARQQLSAFQARRTNLATVVQLAQEGQRTGQVPLSEIAPRPPTALRSRSGTGDRTRSGGMRRAGRSCLVASDVEGAYLGARRLVAPRRRYGDTPELNARRLHRAPAPSSSPFLTRRRPPPSVM
jgi:hypothetical protein